jgi:hypothetical protein
VVKGTSHPATGEWHSIELERPFPLHPNIVEPKPDAELFFHGDDGQPVAVAALHPETLYPSSLFYGFPLEAVPMSNRVDILSRGVGWLSPLGQSNWRVTPSTGSTGERLTYSLIMRNDDTRTVTVSAEHLIPSGQSLRLPSLPPDWTYYANLNRIRWNGQLTADQIITYSWETNVLSNPGYPIYPAITLTLLDWGLEFERFTPFYGTSLDLSGSTWHSPGYVDLYTGSTVTISFLLQNSAVNSGIVQAATWLMEGISPITASMPMTEMAHGWHIPWWKGNLDPHAPHTLTFPIYTWNWEGPVRVDALLSDESGSYWEFPYWLNVKPWGFYLPLITR